MGRNKGDYYAVRAGYKTGIYRSWDECEKQVKYFPGARYKKFLTEEEALRFIEETGTYSAENGLKRLHGRFENRTMPRPERYFSTYGEFSRSETMSIDENANNQDVLKRDTSLDDGRKPLQAHCSRNTENLNLMSPDCEVEVYIKVAHVMIGQPAQEKVQWKLCFPNYVKDSNEHCSRGGFENTDCQAGLKAIIRALESKPDSQAHLIIYTNDEESFARMTVSTNVCQNSSTNQEEERLVEKCKEEMQKCVHQPILQYVKVESNSIKPERSTSHISHSSNHEETGWAEFEPFLSDDEELYQIYIDKGKGKLTL